MQESVAKKESMLPECPHCGHIDYRVENCHVKITEDEDGVAVRTEPAFAPFSEEIYCNNCGEHIADEELTQEIEHWIW